MQQKPGVSSPQAAATRVERAPVRAGLLSRSPTLCRGVEALRRACAGCLLAAMASPAPALEVSSGVDAFAAPRTRIESLSRLYVGQLLSPRLSLGQALYSASSGDAGGAFFWGLEGVGTHPFGPGYLSLVGFIGGGGGAAQVSGDGLMLRAQAAIALPLRRNLSLETGVSWISVSGSRIDDGALYVGVTRRGGERGARPEWRVRSSTIYGQRSRVASSTTRSGLDQADISLLGGEVAFANGGGGSHRCVRRVPLAEPRAIWRFSGGFGGV